MKKKGKALLDYSDDELELYRKELATAGALSNLFSNNSAPFIQYRMAENIYCHAFKARNISRDDSTADALHGKTGVAIKTFLKSAHNQKIAEFNKEAPLYRNLNVEEKIKEIARLRNERIDFTKRLYGIDELIYHCIVRGERGEISVFEERLNNIDLFSIKILEESDNRIVFCDVYERYEFYLPKSTLFKFFGLEDFFITMNIDILPNPLEFLVDLFESRRIELFPPTRTEEERTDYLLIPLFSHSEKRGNFVGERSGLNQWNARGRKRHPDEVYIPFPKSCREASKGFFPPRDETWNMILPDGKTIRMKVCQEAGKALMSNPNRDLGKWLLRDVFGLKPGQLLTYRKMLECGIDSVIIKKVKEGLYSIDFIQSDS